MNGWDAYDWARIIFGAFMIVMGLMNLLAPFAQERRADDWQLRYGDGGTDLSRARRADWWSGFVSIALGAMALINPAALPRQPGFLIAMGGFAVAVALWVLLAEPAFEARRWRRHEAEIALRAAGPDADGCADEVRALRRNPPATQTPLRRRLGASLLILFGGSFLALGITR
jgi:hypothetical protein